MGYPEVQPVESSACAAIGYDAARETLTVQYKPKKGEETGAVWGYHPISQETFDELMAPEASIGSVLHRLVKSNPAVTAFKLEHDSEAA
jgi:hypothetical protein